MLNTFRHHGLPSLEVVSYEAVFGVARELAETDESATPEPRKPKDRGFIHFYQDAGWEKLPVVRVIGALCVLAGARSTTEIGAFRHVAR